MSTGYKSKYEKSKFLRFLCVENGNNISYEYQLKNDELDFEKGVKILKRRTKNNVFLGAVNNTEPSCVKTICSELNKIGLPVENFRVNIEEYYEYINKAKYKTKYHEYYRDNFYEKTLEHFLCYKMINLKEGEKFMDIASEHSPVGEIFHNLTNCISYSQDIMYKPGIHGNMIGSDASDIPAPDCSFDAAIATCSVEHFEKDSDTEFMKEMGRLLKKGGKVVIVPLYLYTTHSCQTDPKYSVPGNVVFDANAEIFCVEGWGNRHGRIYSPASLLERVIHPIKNIDFKIYLFENAEMINISIYCRFILVGTKSEP